MPKVNKKNGVEYTETFKITARNLLGFLSATVDEPKEVLDKQLGEFEKKVDVFPESCQVSPDLLDLGCDRYRECITKDGYRILYTYDTQKEELTVHAILSKRQSVVQCLFERLIAL